MRNRYALLLCLAGAEIILASLCISAQTYKATILGRISDGSGAAVSGAKVTATNLETGISVTTLSNQDSGYVIAQLVPGRYRVMVEAAGFKTFTREAVTLEVDRTLRIDAQLEVGEISDEVLITGEASVIATEIAALGSLIGNEEILDIPLNGRNYLSLALLSPGVVPAAAGANPHNINGARSDHVSYLIDGVSNVDRRGNQPAVTPPIDAIREFRIITNSFSAEYGRLGGAVISVALMSGTNELHGKLYEFHRNDALDARAFFDREVPKLIRNQFGAALGGPVIASKTFFFFSYEGISNREGQTRLARVPTLEERRGLFPAPIRNPFTRRPFPGNAIPADLISPIAARILPFIPEPNRAGAFNFFAEETARQRSNNFTVKLDHYFGGADQIAARFLLDDSSSRSPFRSTAIPGFGATRDIRSQQWSLSYTRIFTSKIMNEARIGFIRTAFLERAVNAGKDTSSEVGITGVASGAGLASIVISGLPEIGDATFLPDEWTDNEYVISDTAGITAGSHDLRFGGDFQRSQHFNQFAAFTGGQIAFLGPFSGNPFADFLLGLPVQTARQVGTNKSYLFSNYFGVFIQDGWKLLPGLTLNLGVRYDLNRPPVEKYDRWANFIPELGRQVLAGEEGFGRALVKTDRNNFAPRIGFAYRPFGDAKTVVRGGYGIYYGFDLQFTMYQLLGATAFPFTRLEIYPAIAVGNPSLANPFPASRPGLSPGANSPNGWDFENPTPYTQNWNLTIGREIANNLGVEASYVGTKGTHQSVTLNINQAIRTPQGSMLPFPGFGRIALQSLGASSSYNALHLSVRKRFSRGLAFRSSFAWSKAIDNASFGSAARQPQDPRDLRAERGLAEFDRRRTWSSDFLYELPFGRGRAFGNDSSRGLDALLGGWQVNAIIHLYDGRPFTPVVSTANQQAGFAVRPDRLAPGELSDPTIEQWFDPAAFVPVPPTEFRFGNSGRNILIGPGAIIFDASVFKEFALPWEAHRLQFRAEFFNVPNRANFGQPDPRIDQPTAGVINSAGPGRQVQFALKYIF
jgi:outer membrane receptor protein involved in Fe transport